MKRAAILEHVLSSMKRSTRSVLVTLFAFSMPGELSGAPLQQDSTTRKVQTLYTGVPDSSSDRSVAAFSDLGAWHGFALPPVARKDLTGGFVGPLLFDEGVWLSPMLVRLALNIDGTEVILDAAEETVYEARPGVISQQFSVEGLSVELALTYEHHSRAVVHARITNNRMEQANVVVGWTGSAFSRDTRFVAVDSSVRMPTSGGDQIGIIARGVVAAVDNGGYRLTETQAHALVPDASYTAAVAVTLGADALVVPGDPDSSAAAHDTRWRRYLEAIDTGREANHPQQVLAEKSLMTLISNWRSPRGGLTNDGLFPSNAVSDFNGFWAWDSWKHAVAIARFDPDLAKRQVRAMFDHQNDRGMIADVVYVDSSEDNWRDTKPPLSGWAVQEIFEHDGDAAFVEELYPKIVRYHRWWYQDRDHDGDGLCEYGSTGGTLEAARWESGMDNAVRFDKTSMVANGDSAWSMDQESVDLNAYLYGEKLALAALANAIGRDDEAARWREDADQLGAKVRAEMFDEERGWFSDIAIDGTTHVSVQGPEGWIPLWVGLATPEQAARVRETMLDPDRFYTYVPFPTVSRNDPEFSDGYWRGLVWIDQVWFGIEGLRRYGYERDAAMVTQTLFDHLQGATTPGMPLHENYDALTGSGRGAEHFSWTAAHLLMLAMDHRN